MDGIWVSNYVFMTQIILQKALVNCKMKHYKKTVQVAYYLLFSPSVTFDGKCNIWTFLSDDGWSYIFSWTFTMILSKWTSLQCCAKANRGDYLRFFFLEISYSIMIWLWNFRDRKNLTNYKPKFKTRLILVP